MMETVMTELTVRMSNKMETAVTGKTEMKEKNETGNTGTQGDRSRGEKEMTNGGRNDDTKIKLCHHWSVIFIVRPTMTIF